MEAPQKTLLVLERNSSYSVMVLEQFKHSTNTVTHATTVPSVDLHYHTHLNWSPTSAAARQQTLRMYLTVQQWKFNKLNPVEWGGT